MWINTYSLVWRVCVGHAFYILSVHLPPPRTLIVDFTMTDVRFGCSHSVALLDPIGQLTDTSRFGQFSSSDPDGVLKEAVSIKIRHYHNIYLNRPNPVVDTSRIQSDYMMTSFTYYSCMLNDDFYTSRSIMSVTYTSHVGCLF
jgi:hypothetical protein